MLKGGLEKGLAANLLSGAKVLQPRT